MKGKLILFGLLILMMAGGVNASSLCTGADPEHKTCYPDDDVFVSMEFPSTICNQTCIDSYGISSNLQASYGTGGCNCVTVTANQSRLYMKFTDLPYVYDNVVLTCMISGEGYCGNGGAHGANTKDNHIYYFSGVGWEENALTWNNQGTSTGVSCSYYGSTGYCTGATDAGICNWESAGVSYSYLYWNLTDIGAYNNDQNFSLMMFPSNLSNTVDLNLGLYPDGNYGGTPVYCWLTLDNIVTNLSYLRVFAALNGVTTAGIPITLCDSNWENCETKPTQNTSLGAIRADFTRPSGWYNVYSYYNGVNETLSSFFMIEDTTHTKYILFDIPELDNGSISSYGGRAYLNNVPQANVFIKLSGTACSGNNYTFYATTNSTGDFYIANVPSTGALHSYTGTARYGTINVSHPNIQMELTTDYWDEYYLNTSYREISGIVKYQNNSAANQARIFLTSISFPTHTITTYSTDTGYYRLQIPSSWTGESYFLLAGEKIINSKTFRGIKTVVVTGSSQSNLTINEITPTISPRTVSATVVTSNGTDYLPVPNATVSIKKCLYTNNRLIIGLPYFNNMAECYFAGGSTTTYTQGNTDSNGYVYIDDLPPDVDNNFLVIAEKSGYNLPTQLSSDFYEVTYNDPNNTEVTLVLNPIVANLVMLHVYDAENGSNVSGAQVSVRIVGSGGVVTRSGVTNVGGLINLTGLFQMSRLDVTVSKAPTYPTQTYVYSILPDQFVVSQEVGIHPLVSAVKYTVNGTVTDISTSEPISYLLVKMKCLVGTILSGYYEYWQDTTDTNGEYSILANGNRFCDLYTVSNVYANQHYYFQLNNNLTYDFNLSRGSFTYTLTGRVVDDRSNAPIDDVRVVYQVINDSGAYGGISGTTYSTNGDFLITTMKVNNNYQIYLIKGGYDAYTTNVLMDSDKDLTFKMHNNPTLTTTTLSTPTSTYPGYAGEHEWNVWEMFSWLRVYAYPFMQVLLAVFIVSALSKAFKR